MADLALISHLMRRAGFGATRDELEALSANSYEDLVEDLLHPERSPNGHLDFLERYWADVDAHPGVWMYRMVNSRRPLEEKIALFWHHVFATGFSKSEHRPSIQRQIDMFRRIGLSEMRTILTELSMDPAMLFWLDNNENHGDEPNENYGRELLELFSMGVGSYEEQDIKAAARAFTGWTFAQPIPIYPAGNYPSRFLYRPEDHDDSVKTFLGERGRFNGEDIVDIIVKQPSTAGFISRHLYNFFVADEAQVPAWSIQQPRDPLAINALVKAYFDHNGEIGSVLRVIFNSDFFKEAQLKRVKCPAELVAGTLKLVGTYRFPSPDLPDYDTVTTPMGQTLFNPPTVEGWHTGQEWINGGTLNERVNFAVNEVGDPSKPGVRSIADRLSAKGEDLSAEEFVDRCLDLVGPLEVSGPCRDTLVSHARQEGPLRFGSPQEQQAWPDRVSRMLQLIVATREYQFA